MVISEVRVDLITIYTTLQGLSGMKKSDAPFSFLLAKRPYKGAYEKAAQAAFSVAVPPLEFQVLPICPKNDNNFWNGSFIAGCVVDKLTNAQFEATYYKSNNYDPAIASATVPYGFSGREYTVSVGVTRKLSAKWLGSAKLGYLENRNSTSGGNTNFRGPLGYLSMQRAF